MTDIMRNAIIVNHMPHEPTSAKCEMWVSRLTIADMSNYDFHYYGKGVWCRDEASVYLSMLDKLVIHVYVSFYVSTLLKNHFVFQAIMINSRFR